MTAPLTRALLAALGGLIALLVSILIAPTPASAQTAQAQAPARLISTDAAVTEILFALGAGDQLVAMDVTSELPPGRPELPRLGYHRALAAEGILALDPNLVIGSEHMGPAHTVDALQRSGVTVVKLPTATSLQGLASNVDEIATALAINTDARPTLADLAPASKALGKQDKSGMRAAFLLNGEGGKLRLAGANTGGNAFLGLLGADNAAGFANYRSVSAEALLELDPDLILVADVEQAGIESLLSQHTVLGYARAARNNQVFAVDARTLVAGLSLGAVDEAARLLPLVNNGAGAQ